MCSKRCRLSGTPSPSAPRHTGKKPINEKRKLEGLTVCKNQEKGPIFQIERIVANFIEFWKVLHWKMGHFFDNFKHLWAWLLRVRSLRWRSENFYYLGHLISVQQQVAKKITKEKKMLASKHDFSLSLCLVYLSYK